MSDLSKIDQAGAEPIATDLTLLRLKLRANGYQPVPVLGAYAGVSGAGKAPKMPGWQTKCINADENQIAGWTKSQVGCDNTGLLCGWKIIGVDIDVLDESLSAKLESHAFALFGATPLRRVGKAPKVLLVYRVATPNDKLSTPALIFGDDPEGKAFKVEILATGQHFVADGIHPDTKQPYVWTDKTPLDVPVSDLPLVDLEKLKQFKTEAEAILREAGGRTKKEMKEGVKATAAQGKKAESEAAEREKQGRAAAGIRRNEKPSYEKIADALDHIPNDLDYDEWIKIGFALYAGLGDGGRGLWESWSATYAGGDAKVSEAKWDTFKDGKSVTVATLFWYARDNGWWWRDPEDSPQSSLEQETRDANEAVPKRKRPKIEIKPGHLSELATRAQSLLIDAGVPIYQRGGELVRPIIETVDASHGKRTKVAQLRILDPVYLRDLLARHATWLRYDKKEEQMKMTNPPYETATTLLARAGEWKFKTIAGVISTPTMRPDGSLLTKQGYDDATGLLLVEPPAMPAIPEQPTRDDALQALELIEGLLTGFPFVDAVSRSVALSGILTTVLRGAFPVTPMHASRAPTAGSGKSYLWDVVAAIAIGQLMPVMSTGANVEETEKRLAAAMMAGQPLISIDNISGELAGDSLCQIIERPVVDLRILGRSDRVRIEARGTSTFSSGNNFTVVGDLCRRVLTVNLDPELERPELRQFESDPVGMVLSDRGKYIAAALTIGRAYVAAGRPDRTPRLASFEGGSDTVRSALVWLGKADPVESMEAARAEDPELGELAELLEAWSRVLGREFSNRIKLNDVIVQGMAVNRPDAWSDNIAEPEHPELYAALEAIAFRATKKRGQKPDARMLGAYLSRYKGRVVDGRRFAAKSDSKRASLWWVEAVAGAAAMAGGAAA